MGTHYEEAVGGFFVAMRGGPAGLVLHGEAGIGKTTLWASCIARARADGHTVLSARVGQAESVLAYTTMADLLADVPRALIDRLPEVQRLAVDRVLLRDATEGYATDQQVLAAGVLSVLEALATAAPVLIAVDDIHWIDTASKFVLGFVARRLKGRVGVLVTERADADSEPVALWMHVGMPHGMRSLALRPMNLGQLHVVISERLGKSFTRPMMVRIAEVSGGNPFYALELARAMDGQPVQAAQSLPATLADLVRLRLSRLRGGVSDVLLAAAAVAAPTVELLATVSDSTVDDVVALLEDAETDGVIAIEGNKVRFAHPLLRNGIYSDAAPARRRAMHRRLAAVETPIELRARHLALAATSADAAALEALDAASDVAFKRGAPAAAAELLELAVGLGGDTAARRIRLADLHFRAGDAFKAREHVAAALEHQQDGVLRALALNSLAAVHILHDGFAAAIDVLEDAREHSAADEALSARTLLMLTFAHMNLGEFVTAKSTARDAMAIAARVNDDSLTSQIVSLTVMLGCLIGDGIDFAASRRALALEDPDGDIPIMCRASSNHALLLACAGRLQEARIQMDEVIRRCVERGAENDLMIVSVRSALVDLWRGNLDSARRTADDALLRAQQIGGDNALASAMSAQALVAAYGGDEDQARRCARAAVDAAKRCSARQVAALPTASLGLLEVSLGNYAEALAVLEPLISAFQARPNGTEVLASAFISDAVEALVHLDRLDDAQSLADAMTRNGARLQRLWMSATGARCRALILSARGGLDEAETLLTQAVDEYASLEMPFETARTLLLLGQVQRRQRRKQVATASVTRAVDIFERVGARLWVRRARSELDRIGVGSAKPAASLTQAELRVAELAASGLKNKDIASALFISVKTVEANLARVYRKLDIRSRAQLGKRIADLEA